MKMLILVLSINAGDAMLFNPLRCSGTIWPGTRTFTFFGAFLGSTASSQRREQKHIYLTRLAKNNDIICLQETHGKGEFRQAVQVLFPQFRFFGAFTLNNVSAGGFAIFVHKNLLPDNVFVNHTTTCQGRDHTVTVRSGGSVMVVVNFASKGFFFLRIVSRKKGAHNRLRVPFDEQCLLLLNKLKKTQVLPQCTDTSTQETAHPCTTA